jgi:hypothetical protein
MLAGQILWNASPPEPLSFLLSTYVELRTGPVPCHRTQTPPCPCTVVERNATALNRRQGCDTAGPYDGHFPRLGVGRVGSHRRGFGRRLAGRRSNTGRPFPLSHTASQLAIGKCAPSAGQHPANKECLSAATRLVPGRYPAGTRYLSRAKWHGR